MNSWYDARNDRYIDFDVPNIEATVTDNPVIHQLLGPDGQILRRWTQRPQAGFRPNDPGHKAQGNKGETNE